MEGSRLGNGFHSLFRACIEEHFVVPIFRRCTKRKKKTKLQNWRRENNKRRSWRRKKWTPELRWPSIWKRHALGPDSPLSASHFRPSTFAIAKSATTTKNVWMKRKKIELRSEFSLREGGPMVICGRRNRERERERER